MHNKITREDFLKLNEDDIMFITNPGRMGMKMDQHLLLRKIMI